MIDNKSTHSFTFQFKRKKHNFVEIDIQFLHFRCFDHIVLKIYEFYNVNVNVINQQTTKISF